MMVHLNQRARTLAEQMDDRACDPALLQQTYAQFGLVNRLFSRWGPLYRSEIRPALRAGATRVLDVGCGGGDVLRRLAGWAARDGFAAEFVGADPDPRAIAFAQAQPGAPNLRFVHTDSHALVTAGETFDLVLSNHVLHHLTEPELTALCQDCQALARGRVLHNDLCRSDLAYHLFPLVGLVFRRSYIVEDGLRSIRRAFTVPELRALVPHGWEVRSMGAFRLLLSWQA